MIAVVAAAIVMLVLPAGSLAVHDTGLFELDGDAVSANAVPPADDWDRVCHQATGGAVCAAAANTTGARGVDWVDDGALNATIFTTGGSKDPEDITNWVWKTDTGGLPDKDNLLHSFAARYSAPPTNPALPPGPTSCPNGTGGPGQPPFNPAIPCEVLYFGSDRYDNSGDAQQGFWLFQNAIGLGNNNVAGGFGFTGAHANGDLLIISDFSNGGGTSTISVYKWDTACLAAGNPQPSCADTNLRTFASSAAAGCATAGPGDAFCGIVNAATITMPWPFLDKSGTPNDGALNGEFFEGGINLSVLGVANQCFSSVLSETRSSTSTTATLKDFVLGGLQQCATGLQTTPTGAAGGSSPFDIGTGSVSVRDAAQLNIVGAPVWSGTLKFFLCKVATINDLCAAGGTQIGADKIVNQATPQPILSDAASVTAAANGTAAAPGRYCWRGEFIGNAGVPNSTDATARECFIVNPAQPTLTTNATPTAQIGSPITDSATLAGTARQPGNPIINGPLGPAAAGTITFNLFGPADPNCAGVPVFTTTSGAVSGNNTYAAAQSFTPTTPGVYHWVASYSGNAPNTLSAVGACGDANEATTVVDANIQITPAAANNPVGTNHTLTGHVNVNNGSGFANAPAGTLISFAIIGGPGTFVGPNTCLTVGATGSCTVVISSPTSGTSTIRAATDVVVRGQTLHRVTGDAKVGDSADAAKRWGDATARTDILNASGAVVTTVVSGTIVHDKVFVQRTAGTPAAVPNPTGAVIFHRYATIDCTGTSVNQTVQLTPGSPSTAISDDFAPTANMSYQAEYLGDANYPARMGACEPLTVTPVPTPAIAIVKNPKNQTVAVGGTATFTVTVTNAGNTVLTDVHVDDPLSPNCSKTKADIPALASMAPGATVTYTCTKTNVRSAFDNVATATGTPPSGPNVSASDTAPVKVKPLQPKKKQVKKKKKPKVVSHKKPKATG